MTVAMTLTPDDLAFLARASALVPSYAKLAQAKQLIEEARAEMAAALAKLQAEVAPAKPAAKPSAKRAVAPLAYGVDLPPPANVTEMTGPLMVAKVVAAFKTHGSMSRRAMVQRAGLSVTQTAIALYALQLQGLASATGRGAGNIWTYWNRIPVLSNLAARARTHITNGRRTTRTIASLLGLHRRPAQRLLRALRYANLVTEVREGSEHYWKVL